MKIILLDKDEDYLSRFKRYIEKKYFDIQIQTCNSLDAFKKLAGSEKYDVVLFDSEFDNVEKETVESCVGNAAFAYISSTQEIVDNKTTIYKYSSTASLHSEICNVYEKKKNRVVRKEINPEDVSTEIITFLPANGGAGSSTMAAACAIALAKEYSVLYVNLEQRPSDKAFFSSNSKKGLSDIVAVLKTKYTDSALYQAVRDAIQQDQKQSYAKVSFIKGYGNILDSLSMTGRFLETIIGVLRDNFDYRYVIIDADFIVSDLLKKLLSQSDKLVLVSSAADISDIKVSEIQRYLDIVQRDEEFQMPECMMLFNQYYNSGQKSAVYEGLPVLARFARYRTNDGTRISTHDILEQVLKTENAFSMLKPDNQEDNVEA